MTRFTFLFLTSLLTFYPLLVVASLLISKEAVYCHSHNVDGFFELNKSDEVIKRCINLSVAYNAAALFVAAISTYLLSSGSYFSKSNNKKKYGQISNIFFALLLILCSWLIYLSVPYVLGLDYYGRTDIYIGGGLP